jgi:NAD(P)-dependent dehydrogenase (short-subunit alcohol dehydrogenase family)
VDPNILGLAGKSALVVGGGYGIGRSSALLLARAGADVTVVDVDPDRVDAVAKEIEEHGVRAQASTGDATNRDDVDRFVTEAASLTGRLDVVINMVGLATWADLFGIDDDAWDHQMSINLRHHLYVGRAAARRMIDQGTGGAMAFVASVSGVYGAPFHGAYGAAKAGLMALTRTMSQEWGPHNIRVNAVAPDMIATPRQKEGFARRGTDLVEAAKKEPVSLGRFGEAEEIAGPLVFLVSELAGFLTGQTLIVDGGVHAAFPHAMLAQSQD